MKPLARVVAAELVPSGRPTLAALVPRFLQWLQFVRERSDNTVLAYGASLRLFGTFCGVIGKGDKQREIPIVPRLVPILRDYLDNVRPKLIWRPTGSLYREKGEKTWRAHYTLRGRSTTLSTGVERKAEARGMLFAPPLPVVESPWVFVHAAPQHRDGEPLLIRSAWALVHRRLSPIVGGKIHPHALRHSFASRLRHNGAPLELIAEVLGHAQLSTTLIYSHLPTEKRREDLARYLEGPVRDQ